MGTNYYVAKDYCECCKRYEELHIGKSSWGWAFSFRGYRNTWDDPCVASWKEWKEYLKDKSIVDECGERISYEEFVQMVEGPKAPGFVREDGHRNLSHNEAGKKDKYPWFNPEHDWDDDLGYSFSGRDFS
jgi:hypothetical protein